MIEAIEPDLVGRRGERPIEVVDATGLLVLPGAVDVHTHTRVASDAEPDRFFQDSMAAAFGGTTTFLAFNNPGTGSSPAARAIAPDRASTEWRAVTAVRQRRRLRAEPGDLGRDGRPGRRAAGDRRRAACATAKAFMVFDFRLDDRAICRGDAGPRRARRHAPGPLRGPRADRRRGRRRRFSVVTRHRATTLLRVRPRRRPWRPIGRWPSPGRPMRPVHVVHLSCARGARRRSPRRRRAASGSTPRRARTT